jgi:hypothetical protein
MQMRTFYIGRGSDLVTQYRFVRESNGYGGRWAATPYLAWIIWRRALKAAA